MRFAERPHIVGPHATVQDFTENEKGQRTGAALAVREHRTFRRGECSLERAHIAFFDILQRDRNMSIGEPGLVSRGGLRS